MYVLLLLVLNNSHHTFMISFEYKGDMVICRYKPWHVEFWLDILLLFFIEYDSENWCDRLM